MNLEVVDKSRISQVKVATIERIVGKRLHVRYYDADPDDNGVYNTREIFLFLNNFFCCCIKMHFFIER